MFKVISLFSGAGGLDLGFSSEGFSVVKAFDFDRDACETYKHNIGAEISCEDVQDLKGEELPLYDVLIGGPPCQAFSKAGKMNPDDPRGKLVWEFVRIVKETLPKCFVMENVAHLATSPKLKALRDGLINSLEEVGYAVVLKVINAKHYGVPQSRERMFMFGIRDDKRKFKFLKRIHPVISEDTSISPRKLLLSLPPPGKPGNKDLCTARIVPAKNPVLRTTAYSGMLFNGKGRPLDLDTPVGTICASMGGNRTPIIDEMELRKGQKPWVIGYHKHLCDGGKPLTADEIPVRRLRRLTIQEAALLQTFPREFVFIGSLVSKYRQVGNSVPPLMARAIARYVLALLSTSIQKLLQQT